MPGRSRTDGEWEGWGSLAACGAGSSAAPGGWQPSRSWVRVVKWCLVYLAATLTVPCVPPGEDGGAYPPKDA